MWPASLLTPEICREFRCLLAMETASLAAMPRMMDALPPHCRRGAYEHFEQTMWQVDLLQTAAELLGAESLPSRALPKPFLDTQTNGLLALRLLNAFEISNYQSALFVARRVPIPEIADICQELMAVEKSFRRWLGVQEEAVSNTIWSDISQMSASPQWEQVRVSA